MDGGVSGIPAVGGQVPAMTAGAGLPVGLGQGAGSVRSAGLDAQGPAQAAGGATSILSLSQTSISASVESFIATYGPVMSSNELLGAVLLLLTLQLMQSRDPDERKQLLGAIMGLASQMQQQSSGGVLMYNSSSLSIESTQITAVSGEAGLSAYLGAMNTAQTAPGIDAGGGLNLSV